MRGFTVTYDIVTPESAAEGDHAECGRIDPWGYHWPVNGEKQPDDSDMSLRQALNYVCPQEDAGAWFSEADGRDDYRTGANETRALHPPRNITPASYARLARLLKI